MPGERGRNADCRLVSRCVSRLGWPETRAMMGIEAQRSRGRSHEHAVHNARRHHPAQSSAPWAFTRETETSVADELDRTTLARAILSSVRLRALRETLRRRRDWRERVFPGFRPDSITRSIANSSAPRFATSPRALSDLITLYVDDLGSEGERFRDQLASAASDPRVPQETQVVLRLAAEVDDLSHLPVGPAPDVSGSDRHRAGQQATETSATANQVDTDPPSAEPSPPAEQQPSADSEPEPRDPPQRGRESSPTAMPEAPPEFIWSSPEDDAVDVQSALTLFGRCISAFIVSRLKHLHGDAWLRKGCGPYRKTWRARAERPSAVEPETLLGCAQLSELQEVIVSRENWEAFAPSFPSKEWVRSEFRGVVELRQAGAHPEQRTIYKSQQVRAFSSMVSLTDRFHAETARKIDLLWSEEQSTADGADEDASDDGTRAMLDAVEKNFDALPRVELIGRDTELTRLHGFWDDRHQRSICVTGRGGVGKSALVYSFVSDLLRRRCQVGERPSPELVLSLTAKENWLEGQEQAPREQRFGSLRRVLEAFIDLCGGNPSPDSDVEELRDYALDRASDMSCLIVLDNLETLPDEELEALGTFVQRLPSPSKVILTDRERRAFSERLDLRGIEPEAAVSLVRTRAADDGVEIPGTQNRAIRGVSEELNGVPLYLHFFANLLVDGYSASEALQRIRGNDMLWLLSFSFDSSVRSLSESARELLYYLAHVPDPVTRSDLSQVVRDGEELDDAVRRLRSAHFIENVEMGSFRITDRQLREYVLAQFPTRLRPDAASWIQFLARTPLQSHPNIERAIQQIVREADDLGKSDWKRAYDRLHEAKAQFGDASEIIAKLGYFAYRLRHRDEARRLLEQAIASGHQDANTHRTLGLVYYYDRSLDEAIRQAEISLTLRPDEPRSLLLLGDALLDKVERSAIAVDSSRRLEQVRTAKDAIARSLIEDDFLRWQRGHNERRARSLEKAEAFEESLAASV